MSRSNPAHTSGPWLYARVNDTTEAIVTDEGDSICDVRGASAADLSLLAAAPDLLAALQLIYSNAAESPEWIRERIAPAIARATYTPMN